jgi:hypothetical protein
VNQRHIRKRGGGESVDDEEGGGLCEIHYIPFFSVSSPSLPPYLPSSFSPSLQIVAMSHGEGVDYAVGDWRDSISLPLLPAG